MFLPWGPLGAGQGVANWLWSKPAIATVLRPISRVYINQMGYRQLGLLKDDIIQCENPIVQKALGRLTAREGYDRNYRLRRAMQQEIIHRDLPKAEWTTDEQDIPYLQGKILEVMKEEKERAEWNNMTVTRK
ncbi:14 kDa subunit of cytochrome bd ubiquinol oxidase [Mrakia frigida]|uniref:ubiquinol--cytochrome-c reductase subunit 7 n=1 Tax=Mrakia frigida TaxID=29902 RepID=UPI003FCC006D